MRLLFHLTRTARLILIAGVVLLALALSVARFLLPQIAEYKGEVVSQLGQFIGNPVRVGGIGARMRGFHPELVFYQMEVLSPGSHQVVLKFGQMRTGLNIKQLVVDGKFQPNSISIIGANVSVRREVDGEIRIIGLDANAETPRWLFEDGLFELLQSDLAWQDLKLGGKPRKFSNVDIRLNNDGGRHKVAIDLGLPESLGQSLSIRMDYSGDIFVADCCSGQLFITGTGVSFGELFNGLTLSGYRLTRGDGDFKLWTQWKDSKVIQVAGIVGMVQAQISQSEATHSNANGFQDLRQLAGRFKWLIDDDGWRLKVNHFSLDVSDDPWPVSAFTVEHSHAQGEYSAVASYLRLEDLQTLLHDLSIVPPEIDRTLSLLKPHGNLFDSYFAYRPRSQGLDEHLLCTRFQNFAVDAWQRFPSIARLDGKICGNQERGRLDLADTNSQWDFDPIFRYQLAFTRLDGQLDWIRTGNVLRFSSKSLNANTDYLNTHSRFKLDIPENAEPFLDLRVNFSDGVGPNLYRYIPVTALSKPLVDWLDQAVIGGQLKSGKALLRGPLMAFPFRENTGVFEVLMEAENFELSFHRNWPHLTGRDGQLLFHQAGAKIRSNSLSMLKVPLESVTASAVDFDYDDYFVVAGNADGRIAQTLKILRHSPLRRRFDPLLKLVDVSGRNQVEMDIKIPMAKHLNDVLVNGQADLSSTELEVFDLQLNRVDGRLKFNQDGVRASGINGSFLKTPAKINVVDHDKNLDIQIDGTASTPTLMANFPSRIWNHVQGTADFKLNIVLPKDTEKLSAEIAWQSDLDGVRVDLPAPLTKEYAGVRPLQLNMHLAEGKNIPLRLKYGDLTRAELQFSNTGHGIKMDDAQVALGDATIPAKVKGIALNAHLHEADIGEWGKLAWDRFKSSGRAENDIQAVNVRVDKLSWSGKKLGSGSLNLQKVGAGWNGDVQGDYARGIVDYNNLVKAGLKVDLDYLRIPPGQKDSGKFDSSKLDLNPNVVPGIDLKSRSVIWDGVDYGHLELQTSHQSDGLNIDNLSLVAGNQEIRAFGNWIGGKSKAFTKLSGNASIADLGLFLSRLGKSKVFNETPVDSEFVLKWEGTPFDISANSMVGNTNLNFGKGRLLSVEPGIGRLFGIFNLDALKSLLLLDFRHLFGKGLAFDRVQSDFDIADGRATIEKFLIDAIPARISVTGNVNLVDEKLDQIVTVVPKGVVALGASVILNQQLPGTSVDGLISREYRVTGKWDDPNITRIPTGVSLRRDSDIPQLKERR